MEITNVATVIASEFVEGKNVYPDLVPTSILPGPNLVNNGCAELGDNTNFSPMTYVATPSAICASGVFYDQGGGTVTHTTGDYIPIASMDTYELRGYFRSVGASRPSRLYFGINPCDASQLRIRHYMVHYYTGTETSLASYLPSGATVAYIATTDNWHGAITADSNRYFGAWGATCSYPSYTYTKNSQLYTTLNATEGWVRFSAPWAGPTIENGAPVANMYSGSNYQYIGTGGAKYVAATWTEYTKEITGWPVYNAVSDNAGFRYGTEYLQILFLMNYNPTNKTNYGLQADRIILVNKTTWQSMPVSFNVDSGNVVNAHHINEATNVATPTNPYVSIDASNLHVGKMLEA